MVLITKGFDERPVPYRMRFHYSLDDTAVYLLTYAYTVLTGAACVGTTLAQQTLLTMLVWSLSERFRSLHDELQSIFIKTAINLAQGAQNAPNERHKLFQKKLLAVVEKQCSLIRFANRLRDLMDMLCFIVLSSNSMLLCVTSFQIATVNISTMLDPLSKYIVFRFRG
ncbi:unnamed protein product [Hermetia illucens]|uniref:Uncharacterized protein n=1 Tax=Hermetia illucens TaxID=343691 RepID=A0A7R8UW49_HERIL|nr:unnamed protein product [Hermetia illucens]